MGAKMPRRAGGVPGSGKGSTAPFTVRTVGFVSTREDGQQAKPGQRWDGRARRREREKTGKRTRPVLIRRRGGLIRGWFCQSKSKYLVNLLLAGFATFWRAL